MRTLIVAGVLTALVLAMPALADERYRDATGENPAAEDIASVVVSNDVTTGEVEFTIVVTSNRLVEDSESGEVSFDVFIDADRNRATGNPHGFDAEFTTDEGMLYWNGKQMSAPNGRSSYLAEFGPNSIDFTVPGKRIRLTRPKQAFRFLVVSRRTTSSHDAVDVAPNRGVYTYTLAGAPPPARVVSSSVAVTVSPSAGRFFAVGPLSLGLADGTMADVGAQRCAASVAGVAIRSERSDSCSWVLPKTSRGKRLVVIVSGRYRGRLYKKRLYYQIA